MTFDEAGEPAERAPSSQELWEAHAEWWIDGLHRRRRPRVRGADPAARRRGAGRRAARARRRVRRRPDQPARRRPTARRGRRHRPDLEPDHASPPSAAAAPAYAAAGADALPFADGSFDAVVACLVFEHIDDVDEAIAEVARVLQPGRPVLLLPQPPAAADARAAAGSTTRCSTRPSSTGGSGRTSIEDETIEEVEQGVLHPVHPPPAVAATSTRSPTNGLLLERMVEPAPPPGFLASRREYADGGHHPAAAVPPHCEALGN